MRWFERGEEWFNFFILVAKTEYESQASILTSTRESSLARTAWIDANSFDFQIESDWAYCVYDFMLFALCYQDGEERLVDIGSLSHPKERLHISVTWTLLFRHARRQKLTMGLSHWSF